ncbi:hypothetical protein KSP39_PZI022569 [Platanthera zijinensis]|uniref:Uncharacterized protein n=1 Tax=Platanthera zijinensis TaxID=2320716 RepID=A0AAP0AV24_9ASPA
MDVVRLWGFILGLDVRLVWHTCTSPAMFALCGRRAFSPSLAHKFTNTADNFLD